MSIINDLQAVAKVLQKAGNIDLYNILLDLQEKILEVEKENSDLRDQVRELKEELKIKAQIVFSDDAYWIVEVDKKDGPYCPHCYDGEKRLIRLLSCPDPRFSRCPKCNLTLPIHYGKPWKRPEINSRNKTDDDDLY